MRIVEVSRWLRDTDVVLEKLTMEFLAYNIHWFWWCIYIYIRDFSLPQLLLMPSCLLPLIPLLPGAKHSNSLSLFSSRSLSSVLTLRHLYLLQSTFVFYKAYSPPSLFAPIGFIRMWTGKKFLYIKSSQWKFKGEDNYFFEKYSNMSLY